MLNVHTVSLLGRGELNAFLDIVRDRLLNVDVLAIRGRSHGDEGVGVIRCGDDNGIDVLGFAQSTIVGVAGDFEIVFGELVGVFTKDARIDIADGNEACVGSLGDQIQKIGSASAKADDGNSKFGIRSSGAKVRGEQREAAGERSPSKKRSAG